MWTGRQTLGRVVERSILWKRWDMPRDTCRHPSIVILTIIQPIRRKHIPCICPQPRKNTMSTVWNGLPRDCRSLLTDKNTWSFSKRAMTIRYGLSIMLSIPSSTWHGVAHGEEHRESMSLPCLPNCSSIMCGSIKSRCLRQPKKSWRMSPRGRLFRLTRMS